MTSVKSPLYVNSFYKHLQQAYGYKIIEQR